MNSQKITTLDYLEARRFFLKNSSYINFDIPNYLNFEELLSFINSYMAKKNLNDVCAKIKTKPDKPCNYENVNYVILSNKDGAYSWRPMQIIHPVLYIYLVRLLTEKANWEYIQKRFKDFSKTKIECISIPRESDDEQSDKSSQVKYWWDRVEQQSLKKSLEFNYLFVADVTDCYGSIYTHSIEWVLDENRRKGVKERLKKGVVIKTLGSLIDKALRDMNSNQTNGIPQGSTLMDFIAELVLGHVDELLTEKIKTKDIKKRDYRIIRYRDDYRILVNDPNIGREILKLLSTVLYNMGLKMNPAKFNESDDIILSSIKTEKLESIYISPASQTLQKEALRIYQLSKKYPNSGFIAKQLSEYYDLLIKIKDYDHKEDLESLIVIFTMIAFFSPKVINWVSTIISIFLEKMKYSETTKKLILKIHGKFTEIPNTGLIDIWLQRISAPLNISIQYSDDLTRLALGEIENSQLWNCSWLEEEVKTLMNAAVVSNLKKGLEEKIISPVIQREEVELFRKSYS